jgi:hypothetical protein
MLAELLETVRRIESGMSQYGSKVPFQQGELSSYLLEQLRNADPKRAKLLLAELLAVFDAYSSLLKDRPEPRG